MGGNMNDEQRIRGRVALLATEGALTNVLVNHLDSKFDDLTLLIEDPEPKSVVFDRRTKLLGRATAYGQLGMQFANRFVYKLAVRRIDELCEKHGLDRSPHEARPRQQIGSVNSEACRDALKALNPDVVAVFSTRIIRSETLHCLGDVPFINYHAGINPAYRGMHPAYWAMVEKDKENVGVTIHLVDEGVDTGNVLYQARINPTRADNIMTYYFDQMGVALPLLVEAIKDGIDGTLRPYNVDLPSRQYFPPTLWQYCWNGITRQVW
jgi:folate-dependent phosphoribosylglycinamide formyltransferase PurN